MKRKTGTITFGRTRIDYGVRLADRRQTIGIIVRPNGTVDVQAPKGTRRKRIADMVAAKAVWILEKQEAAQTYRFSPREFVSGETLLYLGRQYQLKVLKTIGRGSGIQVRLIRGRFEVRTPKRWGQNRRRKEIRAALVAWYCEHAREKLSEIADRFVSRLGFSYRTLVLRDMKTRWGSGGQSGRLVFNWRIILAPRRLVEYVIAHELCHMRHNDHSPTFWRMLRRVIPDAVQRRDELCCLGSRLDL